MNDRVHKKCRYCGSDIATLPEADSLNFHPACVDRSIDHLLRIAGGVALTLEAQTRLGKSLAARYRGLFRLLEGKGLVSREELRASVAQVRMGDQVDDLLEESEDFPPASDAQEQ